MGHLAYLEICKVLEDIQHYMADALDLILLIEFEKTIIILRRNTKISY